MKAKYVDKTIAMRTEFIHRVRRYSYRCYVSDKAIDSRELQPKFDAVKTLLESPKILRLKLSLVRPSVRSPSASVPR